MNGPCPGKDEQLLMLTHGQVGFWARLSLTWHLRRCPACRARLQRFASLSSGLSLVLASPGGPRTLPFIAGLRVSVRSALLGAVLLLMIGSFIALRSAALASPTQPSMSPKPANAKHCDTAPKDPKKTRCGKHQVSLRRV